MKNTGQDGNWISRAPSRSVSTALAFAIVLSTAVLATPPAQAQTFTLLYSFQGSPQDGWAPQSQLILDKLGNLYGTTIFGGSGSEFDGTLFKLDAFGKETVLHNFTGGTGDGEEPSGQLVRYAGNIYGITEVGGSGTGCNAGCGTIFELSGSKESVLHNFTAAGGGYYPEGGSGLARDASGNLYGTTYVGGSGTLPPSCGNLVSTNGCGTVFEVSQGQQSVLYSFGGKPDGAGPEGNLIVGRSGNLYGTTAYGGVFDEGTVFELSPNSDGTWTEHLLFSFPGGSDGLQPHGLVVDAKDNLYGTAGGGLSSNACKFAPCGVVFMLERNANGTWIERVLHRFSGYPKDGDEPFSQSLVRDTRGNLYGTTDGGGSSGDGVVFEVDNTGNEKVLHSFSGPDGEGPEAGLIMDSSGNLYGTTVSGGLGNGVCTGGCGTVFKITP